MLYYVKWEIIKLKGTATCLYSKNNGKLIVGSSVEATAAVAQTAHVIKVTLASYFKTVTARLPEIAS